jgi:hypothetical protein
MANNAEYLGSVSSNPYYFRNYILSSFALNVNGKQTPPGGLHLVMDHETTTVMGYRTLFDASGIHHSNVGLQITHMYINGYFMLLFYLTPDLGASVGHTSHMYNKDIRVDLKFIKPLPEPITCVFYLEFDNSIRIDKSLNNWTNFCENGRDTYRAL